MVVPTIIVIVPTQRRRCATTLKIQVPAAGVTATTATSTPTFFGRVMRMITVTVQHLFGSRGADDGHATDGTPSMRSALPRPPQPPASAAEAIAALLPPPRAVEYWLEGGSSTTQAGEPHYNLAQEATRWLILAVQAAHLSRLIKQAGRRLISCSNFTVNLHFLECWDEILIPELKATLVALGA